MQKKGTVKRAEKYRVHVSPGPNNLGGGEEVQFGVGHISAQLA